MKYGGRDITRCSESPPMMISEEPRGVVVAASGVAKGGDRDLESLGTKLLRY